MEVQQFERKYFIDWLRVIAIILVLYFHTAMIFAEEWSWHIKNDQLSYVWLEINYFLSGFRMPLLFFISGVGTFFALRKRSAWQYIKERHSRLLIPVVFGMFLIVPPQVYFERIFQGQSFDSWAQFYRTVLEFVPYPSGNFSWHHLWFVVYLFFYSVLGVLFFLYLRSDAGKKMLGGITWLSTGYGVYFFAIPSILINVTLCFWYPRTNALWGDWGYLAYWSTFFYIGYYAACNEQIWRTLEQHRKLYFKTAVISILVVNGIRWNGIEPWDLADTVGYKWPYIYGFQSLQVIMNWSLMLVCLGYGRRYLNRSSPLLKYASQAIYPFYIIHQTIIVVVGFYVIQVQESILTKYLFISTVSMVLSVAFYEFVRPYRLTRFMFGIKEAQKKKAHGQQIPEAETLKKAV